MSGSKETIEKRNERWLRGIEYGVGDWPRYADEERYVLISVRKTAREALPVLVQENNQMRDHIEAILHACRSSRDRHVTEHDLMVILGDMYHE